MLSSLKIENAKPRDEPYVLDRWQRFAFVDHCRRQQALASALSLRRQAEHAQSRRVP